MSDQLYVKATERGYVVMRGMAPVSGGAHSTRESAQAAILQIREHEANR